MWNYPAWFKIPVKEHVLIKKKAAGGYNNSVMKERGLRFFYKLSFSLTDEQDSLFFNPSLLSWSGLEVAIFSVTDVYPSGARCENMSEFSYLVKNLPPAPHNKSLLTCSLTLNLRAKGTALVSCLNTTEKRSIIHFLLMNHLICWWSITTRNLFSQTAPLLFHKNHPIN